jgi:hypothetical protein
MTTQKQDEMIEKRKGWWNSRRKGRVRYDIKNISAGCRRNIVEAFMRGGNLQKIGDKYGIQRRMIEDVLWYECEKYKQMKEDMKKD